MTRPLRHPLHDEFIKAYDARAGSYDTEPGGIHQRLATDLVRWAKPMLSESLTSPTKVLDLCCGTGMVAYAALHQCGPETIVDGVDISSKSLKIARAKARSNQRARFYHSSATELERLHLQQSSYSLVTCCSALLLLPTNIPTILHKWVAYLRPGGLLVFDIPAPNRQVILNSLSRVVRSYQGPALDRDWMESELSIKQFLKDASLEVLDVFLTESYRTIELRAENVGVTWDNAAANPMFGIQKLTAAERANGKEAFMKIMRDNADAQGLIRDECRFYICIARRTRVSTTTLKNASLDASAAE
ncbi:MAG: hypothetical protein M1818_004120 [Claussenomyces sp. TS43310]|nr:MAG: hypothetical protein M1818_004120 [Claussenomyces sp. TS43310]